MIRRLALVPFWLALIPTPAMAAWPHDPSVNVLASSNTVQSSELACASDGAGGALIAWIDSRGGASEIYAQRISAAGVPLWTAGGTPLTSVGPGMAKFGLVGVSDGSGGMLLAWGDSRNGNADIYALRITETGATAPGWTANGLRLSTLVVDDFRAQIVPDGSGGAIVSYTSIFSMTDYDIYAQRVDGGGSIPAGWNPAFGVAVCTIVAMEDYAVLCPDGAGGAIITWQDQRSGNWDIYAARVTGAGTLPWTSGGNRISDEVDDQRFARIAADAFGGAVIAWTDRRSGTNHDVYAQRVNASGTRVWWNGALPLCTASGDDQPDAVVPDGSGGAIVAMTSQRPGTGSDIYAQHATAGGSIAAGWPDAPTGGVAVCAAANAQDFPPAISDGAGGAILAWRDARSGFSYDVYAARLTGSGALAAGWPSGGTPICIAVADQYPVLVASDGAGGAIAAWHDPRSFSGGEIYAQRIERFGRLGNPEPVITQVKDVPNDQGGSVKVTWSPSWLDNDPDFAIANYWVWRSVPGSVAREALARGEAVLAETAAVPAETEAAPPAGRRIFLFTSSEATTYAWEFVGSQAAQAFPGYSMTVATSSDSVAGSNPYTAFMVQAKPPSGNAYWSSTPDSGYSVDNRAPAMPSPFTGEYLRSVGTSLQWGANTEADLAGYRLHRGTSQDFVPDGSNLVAQLTGTSTLDPQGTMDSFFKLAALDDHGNLSPYAVLAPSATVDAPAPALPRELALESLTPNPLRGELHLRLAMPGEGRVTLAIYDATGRRVRTLLTGALPAGHHAVSWDGLDAGGRLAASGVYLVRLESEGRLIVRRVLALR